VSRTRDQLRGMTRKGKVTEALVLRTVTPAELKRLKDSRPKMGRGASSGDINGRPPPVQCPPVSRGALPPSMGTTCETWEACLTLLRARGAQA
jgi:hypothetical protein